MLRDVLFNCVVICIKVSNRSTSWNQFPGTNWKGCLFRSVCFFFNMLIYFVISYIVFRVSVADLKRLKINMKIKIRCFKVLLWPKKNHHYTIKICRLQIWKKRCTLDGNLNMYYIWQNKAMNFLQILFKRQRLIVVLVLVILYCFEVT